MTSLLMLRSLLFLPLAALPLQVKAVPAATSAPELLARIQKFYDSTKDLHARFEQQLESQVGGNKKASGEVWLKKPGKMRWDYAAPEKKLMVADGQVLWVYEPEDEQAFKQELKASTLPTQVAFLVGQGKLSDEFEATIVPADKLKIPEGDVVLKLVPKIATAAYRHLLFVVDPRSGQVKQTHIADQQGGWNRLFFSDVEINRGVGDGKFKFSPPKGTRILQQ